MLKKKYDAVLCISVLEHIPNFHDAIEGMVGTLKDDGVLILTFPYSHSKFIDNVYKLENADEVAKKFRYIGHSFSKSEIEIFCKKHDLEVSEIQYAKGWTGEFWRTGKRIDFPTKVDVPMDANLACFLFRKISN
jgi:2-polyprenyl-3-methyl-5-hydroxy-6-metoxy-1,4-benzoquinol methylase